MDSRAGQTVSGIQINQILTNWDQRGPTARERLLARKAERAHRGERDHAILTCFVFDSTRWGQGGWVAHEIELDKAN